jgi:hypothetical protein
LQQKKTCISKLHVAIFLVFCVLFVCVVLISLVYNSVCGIQSTEINLYTFKDFCGVLKTITNTRREINVRENRRVNQVWKTQRTTLDTQDTGRRQTKHKKIKKWLHEVWIYRFFFCCKNPMLQNNPTKVFKSVQIDFSTLYSTNTVIN